MIRTIEVGDIVVLEGGRRCRIEQCMGYQFVGLILGTAECVVVEWGYYHVEIVA